jgi:hypothetical protein
VLKEAIVGFCELKMFKLGPSCVYKHNNGLGVIRTSYFARKSEALLIMVMSRNTEVCKMIDGRIILRWIIRKWVGVVGTGWSWLRIGRGGGHL